MYFVLSPAKNLNEKPDIPLPLNHLYTQPALINQACDLMAALKPLAPHDLSALMGISDKLAQINAMRNQQWAWKQDKPFTTTSNNLPAKPAIYLFDGDVYSGLDAYHMNEVEITYLNQQLGILSGLYGLLKPLDLILAYRLEMGTKLKTKKGDNLYQFWGDTITDLINQRMAERKDTVLVNLASNEYFKAVNAKKINAEIVTPRFEDGKNGDYKVVSFYAKKARGLMVKYAAEHQLKNVEDLKNFDLDNYYFVENKSSDHEYVFRRENER